MMSTTSILGSLAILLSTTITSTLFITRAHLLHIWRTVTNTSADLGFSPTELNAFDVVFIFSIVITKSLLRLVGLLPTLRPLADGRGFELPEIELSAPLNVDSQQREDFRRALATLVKIDDDKGEAAQQPSLLLAAQTTPMMLLTVAHYASPILPLGSVNTKNRFEFLQPVQCAQCKGDLTVVATFGGIEHPGRRTKRGVEFDVTIDVEETATQRSNKGQKASEVIFRQVVTIMQTLPRRTRPLYKEDAATDAKPKSSALADPFLSSIAIRDRLRLTSGAPTAWARVCRDYNPIHMSAIAARLLGLPGRIAHGNHVTAAALELIQQRQETHAELPWALNVAFKRPMVVPIDLVLSTLPDEGSKTLFAVGRGGKTNVEGSIEPLAE